MISTVNDNGYHATSVVEVAARAGVSRKTLLELFGDKEGCFLAAHGWLIARLLAYVYPAWERPGAWTDRIRRSLAALLTAIADRPEAARVMLIETIPAGPRAYECHRAALRAFARFVDEGRRETPFGATFPPNVSQVIVGGVEALVFEEVESGRASDLPNLLPELVYFVLQPYVGHERALLEMHKPRER
jgi:AcrR family transcriptional regulator